MKLDQAYLKVKDLEMRIGLQEFYGLGDFQETLPLLFVCGQQRAGKSSLVNRLTGVVTEDDDRFIVTVPRGHDVDEFNFMSGKVCFRHVQSKRDIVLVESSKRVTNGDASISAWFADRADLILIVFDAANLDIDEELRMNIESFKDHKKKVRLVLNKSDRVGTQQLVKTYGVLMWTMSQIWQGCDVPKALVGAFGSDQVVIEDHRNWLSSESADLYKGKMEIFLDALL